MKKHNLFLIFFLVLFLYSSVIITANPIPVYPHPEPVFFEATSRPAVSIEWIILVYVANFFLDILIVYAGLFIIDRSHQLENQNVLNFSKKTFFISIGIISMIGLLSEFFLGSFIGGLVIALVIIFFSFVFVSKYLLLLCWNNSFRMGLFAVIINIVVWIFMFTI